MHTDQDKRESSDMTLLIFPAPRWPDGSYDSALSVGYTVAQDVDRLIRYAGLKSRPGIAGWMNPPEWEVKEASACTCIWTHSTPVGSAKSKRNAQSGPTHGCQPFTGIETFIR